MAIEWFHGHVVTCDRERCLQRVAAGTAAAAKLRAEAMGWYVFPLGAEAFCPQHAEENWTLTDLGEREAAVAVYLRRYEPGAAGLPAGVARVASE